MIIEDNESVNPVRILISFIFIALGFFAFFYFKDRSTPPKEKVAVIKSILAQEKQEKLTGSLPTTLLKSWKSMTKMDLSNSYQSFVAIVYSLFLHLSLLLFERQRWKINHHILIFTVGFLSFNVFVPYYYSTEMLCSIFIISLILTCKMETLIDLLYLGVFSIAAFMSHTFMFVIGFSFFISLISFHKFREDRARNAVFFKRKNIAGIFVLAYFGVMALLFLLLGIFNFYGDHSFQFMFSKLWGISKNLFPMVALMAGVSIFMRTEREFATNVSTIIFSILAIIAVYYSFKKKSPLIKEEESSYYYERLEKTVTPNFRS